MEAAMMVQVKAVGLDGEQQHTLRNSMMNAPPLRRLGFGLALCLLSLRLSSLPTFLTTDGLLSRKARDLGQCIAPCNWCLKRLNSKGNTSFSIFICLPFFPSRQAWTASYFKACRDLLSSRQEVCRLRIWSKPYRRAVDPLVCCSARKDRAEG